MISDDKIMDMIEECRGGYLNGEVDAVLRCRYVELECALLKVHLCQGNDNDLLERFCKVA